jgi:phosphomannomutase
MVVASISGIRGIINEDLFPRDLAGYVRSFAELATSDLFFVGRDTRRSGQTIDRIVCGTLASAGARVIDYGVISTPALFRESRLAEVPAVMITASHNEPEWNGIKLILAGRGIAQAGMDTVLASKKKQGQKAMTSGTVTHRNKSSYNGELIEMAGIGSGDGVSVAIDLNGGAGIPHAPVILQGIGCNAKALGGTMGVFSRTIDPTNDSLHLLTETVKDEGLHAGFAFDCDGDRLVLVDDKGEKKTGDFMLALAVKKLLPEREKKSVVVSVDTSRAVEDVVTKLGGKVHRAKVGEANVVSKMVEEDISLGGEGSSGGLIDGSYNYCRDSMIAVTALVKAMKKSGSRIFDEVPSYEQVRLKVPFERKKALVAIKKLQKEHPEADTLDGLKIETSSKSWVLIRASGTEDAIRVSAEAKTLEEAEELADSYLNKVKRLG